MNASRPASLETVTLASLSTRLTDIQASLQASTESHSLATQIGNMRALFETVSGQLTAANSQQRLTLQAILAVLQTIPESDRSPVIEALINALSVQTGVVVA